MKSTPYITIYPEGHVDPGWMREYSIKAILIFSKNLEYSKALFRKRVNIHLGDEERIHTDGSIKSIWIKNTLETAVDFGEVEKINAFLKIIFHSIMTIAEVEGWDKESFEKAYKISLADNGKLVWYTQLKANKSRSLKARIKISLDKEGKVPIVAEFFDKESNPKFEILIIDTFLHFVDWESVFEKPTWLDNEKFGFSFLDTQLLIFADSVSRRSETVISEKDWTQAEIEGRIRQLTYRHFDSIK